MRVDQEFDRTISALLRRVEAESFAWEGEVATCVPATSQTVAGFGPYSNAVNTLPAKEQQKIRNVAAMIRGSFQPGCEPIVSVRLVGHADRDKARGYGFERKISRERASQVQKSLVASIKDPSISSRIRWEVIPGGSTELIVEKPASEAQRRQNRRVQLLPRTARIEATLNSQVEEALHVIKANATQAAMRSRSVAGTNFVRVLQQRYLSSYLANPTASTARAAVEAIGAQNTTGQIRRVCNVFDVWERATPLFNGRPFPDALKLIFGPALPANFGAATDILRLENRCRPPFKLNCSPFPMSFLDVDFLLGAYTVDWFDCSADVDRVNDPDLQKNNSKNESQMMHWASGVRFSSVPRDVLRAVFLGYEKFHLEQWDVFGPDPLNDLIAEESGRYMAGEILALRLNKGNLVSVVNEGFRQARAWVGALLRMRVAELDSQIRNDPPPSAFFHWHSEVFSTDLDHHPFAAPAIRQMFASGASMREVLNSKLVARYTEVYTLPLETAVWERTNGPVGLTDLQIQMVNGTLDEFFRRMAAQEQGAPLPPSQESEGELESEWFQGCTPCIRGQKICHKSIVPDDGKCHPLWFDNWVCYC